MSSLLTTTLDGIQHSGGRTAVTLSQLDQHFHPRQFLETLKQATSSGATAAQGQQDAWKIVRQTGDYGEFEIKLLVYQKGEWAAVASYCNKQGRPRRCIYYANGDRQPCFLDLPPQVVLEMAQEDFQRYWLDYYREYLHPPNERSWFPGRQ